MTCFCKEIIFWSEIFFESKSDDSFQSNLRLYWKKKACLSNKCGFLFNLFFSDENFQKRFFTIFRKDFLLKLNKLFPQWRILLFFGVRQGRKMKIRIFIKNQIRGQNSWPFKKKRLKFFEFGEKSLKIGLFENNSSKITI